jgi:choice-of-anchor C domain-containing protein
MKYILAGAVVLCGSLSAFGAAFTNGSFETGTNPGVFTTLGVGSTAITGWTVTAGTIDYIGTYWTAADGTRSVDLSGNGPGAISQTFDTLQNQNYQVIFNLAGNPDGGPVTKTLGVSINGGAPATFTFNTTGATKATMGWVTRFLNFTSNNSGSTTLVFSSLDNPGTAYGPALDNVRIANFGAATPEPGTWFLIGSGLITIGAIQRRRTHR